MKQSSPFVLLDIGANAGIFSLIATSNPHCVMAHSFEPDPNTAPYLRKNLERGGWGRSILHEVGVSDRAGDAVLEVKPGRSGLSRIADGTKGNSEGRVGELVPIVDHGYLDRALDGTPDEPIIVKVDTEGHELPVLRAIARADFVHRVTAVWIELDVHNSPPAPIQQLLSDLGFQLVSKFGSDSHWDALYVRHIA